MGLILLILFLRKLLSGLFFSSILVVLIFCSCCSIEIKAQEEGKLGQALGDLERVLLAPFPSHLARLRAAMEAQEVGLAANEMAKNPEAAQSGQFIPKSKKIIVHSRMLKQGENETLRFKAPRKPGRYPYLCTFPGHFALMRGKMTVK